MNKSSPNIDEIVKLNFGPILVMYVAQAPYPDIPRHTRTRPAIPRHSESQTHPDAPSTHTQTYPDVPGRTRQTYPDQQVAPPQFRSTRNTLELLKQSRVVSKQDRFSISSSKSPNWADPDLSRTRCAASQVHGQINDDLLTAQARQLSACRGQAVGPTSSRRGFQI